MLYPEIVLQSLGRKEKQPVFTLEANVAAKMTAVSRRRGTWGGMGAERKVAMGQPGKGSYLIDRSTHSVLLTSMGNKLALHFSHYKFGTSCYNQALVNPFVL